MRKTLQSFFCVKAFLVLLLSFALWSCSQVPLRILQVSSRLLYVEVNESEIEPRLSVFASCNAEQSYMNFSKFELVHLDSGATWNVLRNQLSFFKISGQNDNQYILGSNKLAFPENQRLEGAFRLSVYDLAYSKVSSIFSVVTSSEPPLSFPVKSSLQGKTATFETQATVSSFFCLALGVDREPIAIVQQDFVNELSLDSFLQEHPDTRTVQFLFGIEGETFLSKIFDLE